MKLVIDIDEHIYEKVMADSEIYVLDNEVDRILIENAIYEGTPLPKVHGRLIDADAIPRHLVRDMDEIDKQPTIIEGSDAE